MVLKVVFSLLCFIGILDAHPHLYATSGIQVRFDAQGISGFQVTIDWEKIFSNDLLESFDTDKNGAFSKAEVQTMEKDAFSNLANYNYLTHLFHGGKKIKFKKYSDLKITMKGRQVRYSFFLPHRIQSMPKQDTLVITNYDSTYFIGMNLDPGMVSLQDAQKHQATMQFFEDKKRPYYFDQITPMSARIKFKRKPE